MLAQCLIMGSALIIFTGCQHSLLHDGLIRTGQVIDIVILETGSPSTVAVNSGDEVRWINKGQGPVQVIFKGPVEETLLCWQNFRSVTRTGRSQYTANLASNETASICFRDAGEVSLSVRAEAKDIRKGFIRIGSGDEVNPSSEKNPRHAARSEPEDTFYGRPGYGVGQ